MGLKDCKVGTLMAVSDLDEVDDLDQVMDELSSQGVHFEQYDQPGITTDTRGVFDGGDFRAAWIKDPDGNTMAITQFLS
jgi:hypothetical protein